MLDEIHKLQLETIEIIKEATAKIDATSKDVRKMTEEMERYLKKKAEEELWKI